ncbi:MULTISPECIES: hypothetical protein [unclassified Burkholderia]|uniref:hypothetical protein n=1 Tax=unclassified Burkholderia TaxID=2613784 RepID=UPI000AB44DF2|nr:MULTISPECIES: hypothetical protein [unclassified Burkholderia]
MKITNCSPDASMPLWKSDQVIQCDPWKDNRQIQVDFKARDIQADTQVKGGGAADAQAVLTMHMTRAQ